MKRFLLIAFLVAFAWGAAQAQMGERGGASATRGDSHSSGWDQAMQLKGPPIAPTFPEVGKEIERVVFDNGMIVYIQEDHRLPLLDVNVLVRIGSYYEPADELGTAELVGELLRTGGTKNFPSEQLEERLDFIAAELSASMGREQASVSLNVPQKDADEALRILADVLRYPAFDESLLELAKQQTIYSLRRSNDTPGPMLRREFSRLLYTEEHPSGRTPTVERIGQISRDDLIRFHSRYFHPNQMMLGLTGDFDKTEMLWKLRELLGDWPSAEVTLPPLPMADQQPKGGVYYISKEVNQSSLRIGHWGTNRDNPDRFAIGLMNSILGGSAFSSRIFQRVRTEEGLAYSVGTAFPTNQRYVSFFLSAAQTKTESTVQAIDSILDEVGKIGAERVSRNEFDTAKEMFLYGYVFRYTNPARSLSALMQVEYDGLPSDHLEKQFAGYQAVTPEDIQRVAREYLHPDQLTIFVVGDYPKFADELRRLGEPQEIQPLQFEDEN